MTNQVAIVERHRHQRVYCTQKSAGFLVVAGILWEIFTGCPTLILLCQRHWTVLSDAFLLDAFMRRMGPIDQQARSLLKSVSQNRQS